MDIVEELQAVTAKLAQEGIDYALCGGLAEVIQRCQANKRVQRTARALGC